MDEVIEKKVKKVKERIFKNENIYSSGVVTYISSYILYATGLNDVILYEEINIDSKASGYVFGIYFDKVLIALTKVLEPITIGDEVVATKHIFKGLFSLDSIGKVVDIYGHDLISNKTMENLATVDILNHPIPLTDRSLINHELLTGITAIDLLYPTQKGQKQLIVGDRRVGKTQIALDTIINQKDKNVFCFYVALGKNKREVKDIYYELTKRGASSYTTIFAAFSDEIDTNIYLTPFVVMNIAENLMNQGYDILIVLDDLTKHAKAYRNISLLSNSTYNREMYPADMFYKHASLLESAGVQVNGGSITILPIVEAKNDEINDYVSSNLASICDGQIVLSKKLFDEDLKPAIDYSRSSMRTDNIENNELSNNIKIKIANFLNIKDVYELSSEEILAKDIKQCYEQGKKILDTLNQNKYSPKSKDEMKSMFHFLDDGGIR